MTILAKSPSSAFPDGVTLRQHLIDVANAVARLEDRHRSLPTITGVPNFYRILRSAALVHDLGKAHPGFQSMLLGGPRFDYRHEVFSLAFSWHDPLLSMDDWKLIYIAVLTHHKDLSEIQSRYPVFDREVPPNLPLQPEFLAAGHSLLTPELFDSARLSGTIPEKAPPTPSQALARITETLLAAGQYGESLERLPFDHTSVLTARFLRGVLILADHSASAAQSFFALERTQISLNISEPYPHQSEAAVAHGNVVLTAPTGSGKTEAALLWAMAQSSESMIPLLFYILPYQASLNAMRQRLAGVVPEAALTLQHGKALQSLYLALLNRQYGPNPELALKVARNEQSMARLQTAPVRILSPYQLLRAAYTLPGHEALWTTPANSLFIVDEIHAYEPGRLAMILATIRHFATSLHSRFFVMTATMPSRLHQLLLRILPASTSLQATPETFLQCRRHLLQVLPNFLDSQETTARILNAAESGLAVLVIANTVSRAQAIAASLKRTTHLSVQLLHSRFHIQDRERKESKALEAAAIGKTRDSGFILVATQVVEVSLNVDFDILFTEPAPLQALFQRFGRVNRTPRTPRPLRPVNVCVMQKSPLPYDAEEIRLSMASLVQFSGSAIDEALLQSSIDSVYNSPFGDAWEADVISGMDRFQQSVLRSCKPLNSNAELESAFSDLFDGYEVVPAGLREEFESLFDQDPIRASQLNVPISKAQFHRLRRLNRITRHDSAHCWIADVPYTDMGLDLNQPR